MAKRRKGSKKGQALHPETVQGILAVFCYSGALLLLLSNFHVAGGLGEALATLFSNIFGVDSFLMPFLFLLIGTSFFFPDRPIVSPWKYAGIGLALFSVNGLLNLLLLHGDKAFVPHISKAGGYIGELLSIPLISIVGYWGALVLLSAFVLTSLLVLFNLPLQSLFALFGHEPERKSSKKHTADDDDEEEEEQTEEDEKLLAESPKPVSPDEMPGDDEMPSEEELPPEDESAGEPEEPTAPIDIPAEKAVIAKTIRTVTIPFDLLKEHTSKPQSGDVDRNRDVIEKTFHQFGIDVEMGETTTGPTVTQYTLRPAQGVKLSRIVGLQNDLALALAAHPLRVEAPIPGKSLVGIEVPNQTVATVGLRELLTSKTFETRKSALSIPLGKDVTGATYISPLDTMPHLLVAGSTGSGKSVFLNTLIVGFLYENSPDELKFIMVDPKRVELSVYDGIPHLLVPPIVKVEDTVNALKWTVREMERRLDILASVGVRDIKSYNEKSEEKMPKIVVIIDELADLMVTSGKEVEGMIVRIAQMARAVGIHLVLATQRPSVDVITGIIKANVPARIAFAVASQMDSRTILDTSGAEKLLGRGDMLFSCKELSKPKRIQGAYVSETEIENIVSFLKKEQMPDYNYAITEPQKTGNTMLDGDGGDDADEPMLNEAIAVVVQARKASTSLLQRRLKVGYGRAARIIDLLEEKGIVSTGEGSKPREVLVEQWPPPSASNTSQASPTPSSSPSPEEQNTIPF